MSKKHTDSIKRNIDKEIKKRKGIEATIKYHNEAIESLNEEISVCDLLIKTLKNELSNLGLKYEGKDHGIQHGHKMILTLSKEYTLYLISISDIAGGPQANDIVNEYKNIGIKTHNKKIISILTDLLNEGLIYKTNPDAQRAVRYKTT